MSRTTANDVERKIERAKMLRGLQGHPGWTVVAELLEDGIRSCRNRLLMPDCDFDEVRQIRGVVSWMANLLKAPSISDDLMAKWEQEVAFRRKSEMIRTELGMVPDQEAQDEKR